MKNTPSGFASATLIGLTFALSAMGGASGHAQETGDVIVAFEMATRDSVDVDIGAQRLSRDGKLRWGEDGKPVLVAGGAAIETSPAACDDGQGGAWVFLVQEFVSGSQAGDKNLVVQHLDRDGRQLWSEPQQVAGSRSAETQPLAVSDGEGGAIVVYLSTNEKGDSNLLAQRIGPDGRRLWNDGTEPNVVAASTQSERHACAIPDGQGGLLVFFEHVRQNGDVDIKGQHVMPDGRTGWIEGNGPVDIAASEQKEMHPVAVSDGAGGAILAFEVEYTSGEYRGDIDILGQRVAASGALLWGDPAHAKVVGAAPGYERNPAAIADGAGGIIVAFEMEPVTGDNKGDIDVLAQRMNRDGQPLWEQGQRSVPVSTSTQSEREPALVADGAGGCIAAVEVEFRTGEYQGDQDVYAQRVSAQGTSQWNDGKKSALVGNAKSWQERRPIALADGAGGAVIVYGVLVRGGQYAGDEGIAAARIDGASGRLPWHDGEQSVLLAATEKLERNPSAFVVGAARVE
jgi:hypothetical protein